VYGAQLTTHWLVSPSQESGLYSKDGKETLVDFRQAAARSNLRFQSDNSARVKKDLKETRVKEQETQLKAMSVIHRRKKGGLAKVRKIHRFGIGLEVKTTRPVEILSVGSAQKRIS
jgi:hypothetical protein